MSVAHEIIARLRAEGASQFASDVHGASEAVDEFGDQTEEATERAESGWGRLEDSIGKIAGVTAAAGAGLEGFARGQQGSNELIGRLAVSTGMARDEIRGLATDLTAGDHTFDPQDALAGMDALQRRGIDTRDEIERLLPSFDAFADATGKAIDDGIAQAERIMSATGQGLDDLTDEHLDTLTYLNTQTRTNMGTFERNLGRIADPLQDLGLDLHDAAAGVEVFADRGYDGRESVREFRRAVEDSDGDMSVFLDRIGLTNDEWADYQDKIGEATGLTRAQADVFAETATPLQRLQSRVNDLMFEYGGLADAAGVLSPVLVGGAATMYTVSRAVTFLRNQTLLTATAKYALATAKGVWGVAASVATVAAYGLGAAFRFMLGPIGLAITAIGAAVAAGVWLANNWDEVSAKVSRAVDWVGDKVSGVFGGIVGTIRDTTNGVIGAVNGMIDGFNRVEIRLPVIPDWVPFVGGRGGQTISLPNVPRIPTLGGGGGGGFSGQVQFRNAGGRVEGMRGANQDTVLAALTTGEWVLRRDAADALGPDLLATLNRLDGRDDPLATAIRRTVAGPAETHEVGGAGGGGRGPQTWRQLSGMMGGSGVPHRVTSTVRNWGGTSYHETGHAIDLAGPTPSSSPTPAMGRIFDFWAQHAGGLAELIYAGRSRNVKNGRWVAPYAVAQHRDHVHVAATAGGLEGAVYADDGGDGSGIPRWARPVLNAILSGFRRGFGLGDDVEHEWASGAYVDRPYTGRVTMGESEPEFVTPESQLATLIDERLAAAHRGDTVHVDVHVAGDVLDPEAWFARNRRPMGKALARELADQRART